MNYLSGKWIFALALSILLAIDCPAYFSTGLDTIPPPEKRAYKGYRLHLTDLKIVREKGQELKINYTLINTGRENIQLGQKNEAYEELQVLFGPSIQNTPLKDYPNQIREALLTRSISIVAGQIKRNNELSFSTLQSPASTPVSNDQPQESSTEEAVTASANTSPREVEIEIAPITPVETVEDLPEKTDVVADAATEEKTTTNSEKEEEAYVPYLDRNNCSDLVIASIKILKRNKRSLTLEYTLINQGTGPAYLFGSSKAKEDNVAIRANISGSTRLSRGAIVIGGDYITEGLKAQNGKLMPNEQYVGTIKLDTYKMTKFTPNIILELDAYNSLIECDETNNRNFISVE